jgi:conjugative relaxase-like TrwC/TraI family protein
VTSTIRPSRTAFQHSHRGRTSDSDGEHDCYLRQRDTWRALIVAWFRPMGADEVAYHQATVVGRGDDHAGAALVYYGSRGETPLRWAGAGATRLGLAGEVTPDAYDAAFGVGGFRHPVTGERLVASRRPGFELVVSAHKSVAVLGVIDRAEDMHTILDVETTATMDSLDDWFQDRGGRRGRSGRRTATGGLVYATTRHATSRAGDPCPHDHVLVANVAEMFDEAGGFKALDSAALRDTVEAATMVGRLYSAARAVELGFEIERDDGPSGRLRHWRIVGIPDAVCDVFSKRADEIAEHLATTGHTSYRARGIAARATRTIKRHTGLDELLPQWQAELAAAGWPVDRLAEHLARARRVQPGLRFAMTDAEIDALGTEVLDLDGQLMANHKAFTRTNLIAEIAPRLYGRDPAELDRTLARLLASTEVVPLIGVAGAREQAYTTAQVLRTEATIARVVETLAERTGPALRDDEVATAIAAAETARGHRLTDGQRQVVERLCQSGKAVSVVVGVAGSGKTTALDTAATAIEAAGYRVLGTSTSGQAARTLGAEAGVEARTFASLLWRLEHGHITLDQRTVVVVDETGMADDTNLARLALAVDRAGASLVLVGDHCQLGAVGPGGALAALLHRRPDLAVVLDTNVRQRDSAERAALAELRDGDVAAAVAWYARSDRVRVQPTRLDTLVAMTEAWAADIAAGHDTALLAWRRLDVADLNRLARERWDQLGHLPGDDVKVTGGRYYASGDRLVALAPNPSAGIVTSEPLTVLDVDRDALTVRTFDGREEAITGDALDTEHLDYGYALTVHRAQGATYDRAHVLADGGGRELAYVAMSRARDHTSIHATADDLAQAIDDLQADWGVTHHQRWITDTPARPGREPEPARSAPAAEVAELPARSVTERRAAAQARLVALNGDLDDLFAGAGRWTDTPAGRASVDYTRAAEHLTAARDLSIDPRATRRRRRVAARSLVQLERILHAAEQRWSEVGAPDAARLQRSIVNTDRSLARLRREAMNERLEGSQAHRAERVERGPDRGLGL